MKTVRMLVILVLVLVGLEGIAKSKTSTHVYGADNPADDIQAVKEAVDNYDIVYLHGTFDFGGDVVEITRSVEILGKGTDAVGEYLTQIKRGGWGALKSVVNPDVKWAVRDIEFDETTVAILTRASKRFEVTGCSMSSPGGGAGIILNGYDVTGSATIKENHIDLSGVVTHWGCGVFCQMILADIEIVDNTVENFPRSGLWINSSGNIEIEDNTITAGPTQTSPYRNGILVGSWWQPSGKRGNIEVTGNTITAGGNNWEQGIAAEDWEQEGRAVCRVEDNVITYVGDSPGGSGILLLSRASFWTFKNNTINGGGHKLLAGIALYPELSGEPGPQEYNVFSDNHVSHAEFVLSGVYVHSSAQASYNEFVRNEFENIVGDGSVVDGDCNWLLENKFEHISGDGIILEGDYNMIRGNKFLDIVGTPIVDDGVGNVIEDND
jgi:hypothetical protein